MITNMDTLVVVLKYFENKFLFSQINLLLFVSFTVLVFIFKKPGCGPSLNSLISKSGFKERCKLPHTNQHFTSIRTMEIRLVVEAGYYSMGKG